MDEATFVAWRVKPGDRVKHGDVVAAVETAKGIIDIEIFDTGIVDTLLIEPGARIPVGTVLAQIKSDAPGSAPGPVPPATATAADAAAPAASSPASSPPAPPPAARKHAAELGVALESVHGTGPHGVITIADVERSGMAPPAAPPAATPVPSPAAAPPAPPPATAAPAATAPATDMRATIAAAMTRAKREIPHYYLATTVDLRQTMDWLAMHNRDRPVTERLLAGLLFVRAVARALTEFPDFSGHYADGRFQPGAGIHVGVAVSLRGGGLVAPALHQADQGALSALMPAFQDLVTRARSGHLRASEMTDATITVTSLGERGVDAVFPVIYPPQVAILGFGRVDLRPVVTADGGIAAHPTVTMTLAADHRVSDGHRGGLFVAAIERHLKAPEHL